MKKKIKTYFLLVVVIVIWGAVIVQVYNGLNDNSSEFTTQMQTKKKIQAKNDTSVFEFSLGEIKRDPFLDNDYNKPKPRIKTINFSPQKEIEWPQITYKGLIKNKKESFFVININGKEELLKIAKEAQGIKLLEGNSTSIKLKYKNQIKSFNL